MSDMSAVIQPKSDQLNADSLLAGPITVTIERVEIRPGAEQPIAVRYVGDEGKPWRPCKSMARLMVSAWGPDAKQYAGKRVTLFHDPEVKWGGAKVGGIRVSHMSDLRGKHSVALTATKGQKKIYTVQPLPNERTRQPEAKPTPFTAESVNERPAASLSDEATARAQGDPASLGQWWNSDETKARRSDLYRSDPDAAAHLKRIVEDAIAGN